MEEDIIGTFSVVLNMHKNISCLLVGISVVAWQMKVKVE